MSGYCALVPKAESTLQPNEKTPQDMSMKILNTTLNFRHGQMLRYIIYKANTDRHLSQTTRTTQQQQQNKKQNKNKRKKIKAES